MDTDLRLQTPLISCLCVTRGKPDLLMRSIRCFLAQSYLNKELLILYESDDTLTENKLVCQQFPSCVRYVRINRSSNYNLGRLRNYAVSLAEGQYICQWDDDDWYHFRRLEYQFNAIKTDLWAGSILTRWLVFDTILSKAYVSHARLWEGSIMCSKEVMINVPYLDKTIGEDTAVIDQLFHSNSLVTLPDSPNLYIYIFHGKNTWHRAHWEAIFASSLELEYSASTTIQQILSQEFSMEESSELLNGILAPYNLGFCDSKTI